MRIYTFQNPSFYSHYLVLGAAVAEAQYELSKASIVETAFVSEPQTAFEQSRRP
jgi:surface polysaccharide O-acyltransferase-like enzyme